MRRIRYNFHNETSLGAGHPTITGGSQPALANTVKVINMRSTILAGGLVFSAVFVLSAVAHRSPEAANTTARADGTRSPVLVELFTSEGCSSCPPADELLRRLDESQPVAGAEVIALSEHVDYWDDGGWKDPFSAHANSERQDQYAARFRRGGVYTPQMVVDGEFEFVGSDARTAVQFIEKAASVQKVSVTLTSVQQNQDGKVSLHIEAAPLPNSS